MFLKAFLKRFGNIKLSTDYIKQNHKKGKKKNQICNIRVNFLKILKIVCARRDSFEPTMHGSTRPYFEEWIMLYFFGLAG